MDREAYFDSVSGKAFCKTRYPDFGRNNKVRLTQQIPYKSDPDFLLDARE